MRGVLALGLRGRFRARSPQALPSADSTPPPLLARITCPRVYASPSSFEHAFELSTCPRAHPCCSQVTVPVLLALGIGVMKTQKERRQQAEAAEAKMRGREYVAEVQGVGYGVYVLWPKV